MKAVVLYEPGTASMEAIVAAFPRHKAFFQTFLARGEIIGIGTFAGGRDGSMAIFRSRASAEAFVKDDPFVVEGLVGPWSIKDWNDTLLE